MGFVQSCLWVLVISVLLKPVEMHLVIQVTVLTHSDLVFSLWCSVWFLDRPIKMYVSVPNVVDNVINGQLGQPWAWQPLHCPQQSTITSTFKYRKLSRWPFPFYLPTGSAKKEWDSCSTNALCLFREGLAVIPELQVKSMSPWHPQSQSILEDFSTNHHI